MTFCFSIGLRNWRSKSSPSKVQSCPMAQSIPKYDAPRQMPPEKVRTRMSEQDNGKVATLQRPTTDDPNAWKTYWETQAQPWRTEPEIDAERQKYLAERRNIEPDI